MLEKKEHDPTAWYTEMEEKAKEDRIKDEKRFSSNLNANISKALEESRYLGDLLVKGVRKGRDEERKKREKEIELAKQRANEEIERKFEDKGIKSEKTIAQDEAWEKFMSDMESGNSMYSW